MFILLFHVLILYPDASPQQIDLPWAESSVMVAQTKPPLKLPSLVLCHSDEKLTVFYPKASYGQRANVATPTISTSVLCDSVLPTSIQQSQLSTSIYFSCLPSTYSLFLNKKNLFLFCC